MILHAVNCGDRRHERGVEDTRGGCVGGAKITALDPAGEPQLAKTTSLFFVSAL